MHVEQLFGSLDVLVHVPLHRVGVAEGQPETQP
jgi:hypothetical protein